MVRVVCISDTHGYHKSIDLPHGDILIHAGDFSSRGREYEVRSFGTWFAQQLHQHKIIIAGNHDMSFEGTEHRRAIEWLYDDCIDTRFIYLQDSEVTLTVDDRQIKVYGSPWQPEFCNWAFNAPRGKLLKAIWSKIPTDTDILVTHGPPAEILDLCDHGERVGCQDLLNRVKELDNLKLHIFGHIHEAYGLQVVGNTTFVNASSCDVRYRPIQPPIVVDI
jgi:predicted phosphodiesterase